MKIENFKEIKKPNSSLKATFLVNIPEWDFFMRMTYFEKPDGKKWFGYPIKEFINELGETKRLWLAYFGEMGKARFEDSLINHLNNFLNHTSSQNLQDPELPF